VLKTKRPPGAKEFDLFAHVGGKCPGVRRDARLRRIRNGAGYGGRPQGSSQLATRSEEEVAWRCQNIAGCPAQLMRRVEYFAARKALDIESLGGIVAEKLVERGLGERPARLVRSETGSAGQTEPRH
jgi:hypothetical protein